MTEEGSAPAAQWSMYHIPAEIRLPLPYNTHFKTIKGVQEDIQSVILWLSCSFSYCRIILTTFLRSVFADRFGSLDSNSPYMSSLHTDHRKLAVGGAGVCRD